MCTRLPLEDPQKSILHWKTPGLTGFIASEMYEVLLGCSTFAQPLQSNVHNNKTWCNLIQSALLSRRSFHVQSAEWRR